MLLTFKESTLSSKMTQPMVFGTNDLLICSTVGAQSTAAYNVNTQLPLCRWGRDSMVISLLSQL